MASELIVQTIQGPSSGANANKVLIPSGHTLDVSGGTLVPSAGQVLQVASGYNQTPFSGTSTNVWNTTFSFHIDNVKSGSSLLIEMHPAGLMEYIEAVIYGVFKNSTELGRTMHNGSGNGGWRTAPTVAICTDTNPDVGTNTYNVKVWSTSPPWYINYTYPSGYTPRTMWKITEIKQ